MNHPLQGYTHRWKYSGENRPEWYASRYGTGRDTKHICIRMINSNRTEQWRAVRRRTTCMNDSNTLKFKSLGIYTQHEHVVYMREDCHICISEGFQALTRLRITKGDISIVASLNVVRSDMLALDEIGLSEAAVKALTAKEGDEISISHLEPIDSLRHLRAKIFDHVLDYNAYGEIITDIVKGEYSNIHLSAFITACAGGKMNIGEISDLTKAMIASGERLRWGTDAVVDKHCIGGLPGNRTTPIVVL